MDSLLTWLVKLFEYHHRATVNSSGKLDLVWLFSKIMSQVSLPISSVTVKPILNRANLEVRTCIKFCAVTPPKEMKQLQYFVGGSSN